MTVIFSIEEARADLLGGLGYSFDLESSFDQARAVSGLASSAHAFINTAVKCFLVGLDEPGIELAKKSVTWLSSSISADERPKRYFPEGTEAIRLYDFALAKWLLGERDTALVRESIEKRERYFLGKAGRDPVEVASVLVEYLDGGCYELVRNHVDRLWRGKRMPPEVDVALALCEDGESSEKIHPAVTALLQKTSNEWLGRGHFDRFAKWVKVGGSRMTFDVPAAQLLRQVLQF